MAHIHDLIDFTVAVYIIHDGKVLFIHHIELNKWLPVGGHIELDEEPEQALFREIAEETGLTKGQLEILSGKPNIAQEEQRFLFTPNLLDFHNINNHHWHVGIIYFVRSGSDKVKLEKDFHSEIKWLSEDDLVKPEYNIREDLIYAAKKALEKAVVK